MQHMDPVLLHQQTTKLQMSGCVSMTGQVRDLDEGAASPGHLPDTSLSPQDKTVPQPLRRYAALWLLPQTVQKLRNEGTRLEQTAGHENESWVQLLKLQDDEERQRPQRFYKIICLEISKGRE